MKCVKVMYTVSSEDFGLTSMNGMLIIVIILLLFSNMIILHLEYDV